MNLIKIKKSKKKKIIRKEWFKISKIGDVIMPYNVFCKVIKYPVDNIIDEFDVNNRDWDEMVANAFYDSKCTIGIFDLEDGKEIPIKEIEVSEDFFINLEKSGDIKYLDDKEVFIMIKKRNRLAEIE